MCPGVWLLGLGFPELVVGPIPDTAGCRVWGILKLVLAYWFGEGVPQLVPGLLLTFWWVCGVHRLWGCSCLGVGVCLLVGKTGPESRTGSLTGRARDPRACVCPLGSLAVEPWGRVQHCCVGPGPGPSSGQGHVQGQLWSWWALKKLVYWWEGLCPCPVSCLARGVLVLVSTGYWGRRAVLGPEANKLERGFQDNACQQSVYTCYSKLPKLAATSVYVPI